MHTADCKESTHYKDRNGYAQIRYLGKTEYHHRVSYILANGLTMAAIEGKYILHACDNPACINPQHLSVGTAADNSADMKRKGRSGWKVRAGEASSNVKLTASDVLAIRAATRKTQVELAKEYGLTQANVSSILLRKTWKHI